MRQATATERPRPTIVRGARLFDGTGPLSGPAAVLVEGGRIVAVGSDVPDRDDSAVVDLPGATLLPGLVDTHLHLALDASADPVGARAARDDTAAREAMTAAARTAALAGVTTVRDLGDRDYVALGLRAAARTDPTLPTILASGPPLTTPGGHCHYLGGVADGIDGVRAAVREHAERGVDIVKIMASGGNLTPGTRPEQGQFEPDELRAAVDEAHRHGLPVTAHAHGTQAVADSVAAGVDGLEHATFMTADGVDPIPSDLLADIVARRISVGLTLGVNPARGPALAVMLARIPALLVNAELMWRSGVRIVAGPDGGVSPAKPHDVLPWAVEALARLPMGPLGALVAATAEAAAACGLTGCKGRLAPGHDADLLAVDGDPLVDPAALRAVRAVFVRGVRLR